jgi:hypothetical protein
VTQNELAMVSLLIAIGGMIVGAFVIFITTKQAREEREMQHRERMVALEKGVDLPLAEIATAKHRTSPLNRALMVLASGIALSFPVREMGPASWMWGFWLALLGIAMLVHWLVRGREEWDRDRALNEELRKAYIERLRTAAH